jgi:hypothetical protein
MNCGLLGIHLKRTKQGVSVAPSLPKSRASEEVVCKVELAL